MSTYSYVHNGPWGSTKVINGITFTFGVPVNYSSDQPILNEQVPELLDRYIDGILSNSNLEVPYIMPSKADIVKYGPIQGYTAAQLASLATTGGLILGAHYVESDTGIERRAKSASILVEIGRSSSE